MRGWQTGAVAQQTRGRFSTALACVACLGQLSACSGLPTPAGPASHDPAGLRVPSFEQPLQGLQGDATRGRDLVADRTRGLCLLCHSGPFEQVRHQGNLAPDLTGVGSRLTLAQLRQRVIDSRSLNPDSLMPAFHRTEGLNQVASAWQGKPLLDAQQIEDVVAFLAGLKDPPPNVQTNRP